MLTRIDEAAGGGLEWRQVGDRPREFELVSGSGVHGRLSCRAGCRSLAIGAAANGRWIFEREGLLWRRMTARHERGGACAATCTPRLGGGILEVEDGQRYVWTRKGCRAPEWILRQAGGEPLVRFCRTRGFAHLGARVELGDTVRSLVSTPFLILVGWYLIVLHHEDAEMAAVTTVLMGGAS